VLSGLEIALAVAACVAGVTGSWSPCGFSMVETIGPTGHEGGRRTTLTACATFTVGALAGGALTFGSLDGRHDGGLIGIDLPGSRRRSFTVDDTLQVIAHLGG